MPELEPVDEIVMRLVSLAGGDPGIVERVCRDLYGVVSRRFTQAAINNGDAAAEWVSERIGAYLNDLANIAEDNAEALRVKPKRIQRRRTTGWRMPEGAMYVGRPSRWGNPFRIYKGHTSIGPTWPLAREAWHHIPATDCMTAYVTSSTPMEPGTAVQLYRDLLAVRARDERDMLRDWLAPLVGRDLVCWCPPEQPCHADVLLEVANIPAGAA